MLCSRKIFSSFLMSAGVLWLFQMVQKGLGGKMKQGRYRCRKTHWCLLETKPNISGLLQNLECELHFLQTRKKVSDILRKPKIQKKNLWVLWFCATQEPVWMGVKCFLCRYLGKTSQKTHGMVCCMVVCVWLTDRHVSAAASQRASVTGGLLPKITS